MEKIPFAAVDLIEKLDQLYPEKCPAVTDSEREIWMYAGARELVRRLVHRAKQEQEDEGVGHVLTQRT
jgi:F420-dependent methylenetetrahydromethanopterin dehydrogenase